MVKTSASRLMSKYQAPMGRTEGAARTWPSSGPAAAPGWLTVVRRSAILARSTQEASAHAVYNRHRIGRADHRVAVFVPHRAAGHGGRRHGVREVPPDIARGPEFQT